MVGEGLSYISKMVFRGWVASGSVALMLVSAIAWPREPLEEVSIEYHSAPCGDAASFVDQVRERTNNFRLSDRASEVRHFEVTIAQSKPQYVGELRIVSRDQSSQVRRVEGESCEALFDAMALMTALAIDPSAPSSPDPDRVDEEEQPEPRETTPTAEPDQGEDQAEVLAPDVNEPAPESSSIWRFSAGAHLVATQGLVARPLWGGQFDAGAVWVRRGVWSPALRLLGRLQGSGSVPASQGSAQFQLFAVGFEGCPAQLVLAGVSLRPCGVARLDLLQGSGVDVENARSEQKTFGSLGAALRAEIKLHHRVGLDGSLEGTFPLRRDRFLIGDEVVSRANVLSVTATLGVTVWLF